MGSKIHRPKQKPSNKIPKDILRNLEAIAKNLPAESCADVPVKLRVKGETVLKHNPTANINGNALDPNKAYLSQLSETHKVNHYRRLVTIFKEQGWQGVENYIKTRVSGYKPVNSEPEQTKTEIIANAVINTTEANDTPKEK